MIVYIMVYLVIMFIIIGIGITLDNAGDSGCLPFVAGLFWPITILICIGIGMGRLFN